MYVLKKCHGKLKVQKEIELLFMDRLILWITKHYENIVLFFNYDSVFRENKFKPYFLRKMDSGLLVPTHNKESEYFLASFPSHCLQKDLKCRVVSGRAGS